MSLRYLWLAAWPCLAGCIPPSSLFMLTDGRVPSKGENDLTAGFGPVGSYRVPSSNDSGGVAGPLFNGDLGITVGLGDRTALSLGGGLTDSTYGTFHGDVQVRLVRRADTPIQSMVTGGIVGYFSGGTTPAQGVGVRGGTMLSGAATPKVRPYGGLRGDVTWTNYTPPTEPDEGSQEFANAVASKWSSVPYASLNGGFGTAFQVGERTTLGLEFAVSPSLSYPGGGFFGGAIWVRGRVGEAKEGAPPRSAALTRIP